MIIDNSNIVINIIHYYIPNILIYKYNINTLIRIGFLYKILTHLVIVEQ